MTTPLVGPDPDDPSFVYEEFALLGDNCAEFDLPWDGTAHVERVETVLSDGRKSSAIKWGSGSPEVVFLHGGAQNAHTWDTVALMLRPRSLLALDLSGHGHSSWRADGSYNPRTNAVDAAATIDEHAPDARLIVAMSLGGLTANSLAATFPWLVERLVVIDVTPGVNRDKAADIHAFIEGPQSFASFTEIFDRTVMFNPTRSASSLRRGILHNAHRNADGTWEWNYDRSHVGDSGTPPEVERLPADLWDDVSEIPAPYLLLRAADSPVVDDEDVAELLRRKPDARVEVVQASGHSIQGDQPAVLAGIIERELALLDG
ncbi:MAG: alpha/beta hydrolase [Microthrixaceae bacterium]|nr:alpha/beta hydrolase [Microthrixaceae bacterium]